jgi:hypothetical protein
MRALPLVVGVLALVLGIVHLAVSRGGADKTEVADLQSRVEALSGEVEDLRAGLRTNEAALRRYADLAQTRNAAGAGTGAATPPPAAPAAPPPAAPETAPIRPLPAPIAQIQEQAHRTFMDRSKPPQQRVDALMTLRKSQGGRTEEVARVALEMAQDQAVSAPLRSEALRHLSRLEYESMKQPLLSILARERDSGTRTEALELLQRFLGDPGVMSAVQAAQNDPDRRVRDEARQRLADWQSKPGR